MTTAARGPTTPSPRDSRAPSPLAQLLPLLVHQVVRPLVRQNVAGVGHGVGACAEGWAGKGDARGPKEKKKKSESVDCVFFSHSPATLSPKRCVRARPQPHTTHSLSARQPAPSRTATNDGSAPCDRAAAGRAGGGGRGAVSLTGEVGGLVRLSVHANKRTGRGQGRARSPPLFFAHSRLNPPPPPPPAKTITSSSKSRAAPVTPRSSGRTGSWPCSFTR